MTARRHAWLATAGPAAPLLRPPTPDDGAAVHNLIRLSPPLDLNSCYAYLLQGLHFAETCVLATDGDDTPLGYISGYLPPGRPDTLFIWQVAVAERARGQGLAAAMLHHLLTRPACRAVQWLETTVAPDNTASARLFHGLARDLGCACTVHDLFPRSAFGAGSPHEAEPLFRIGPIPRRPCRSTPLHPTPGGNP